VIDTPELITHDRITSEWNVEIRKVMIERFGAARYLEEAGGQLYHEDECGRLWWIDLDDAMPVLLVEVANATCEPDGSHQR